MKTMLLAFCLLSSYAYCDDLPEDVLLFKKQYEAESKAALRPLALKYAAQLNALHRAALQAGDAAKALLIEHEVAELQAGAKIDLPQSDLPGAVNLKEASVASLSGSNWTVPDGGVVNLNRKGAITTSWGWTGKWTIETATATVRMQWDAHPLQKWKLVGTNELKQEDGKIWTRLVAK